MTTPTTDDGTPEVDPTTVKDLTAEEYDQTYSDGDAHPEDPRPADCFDGLDIIPGLD